MGGRSIFWLVVIVIAVVVEACTVQLVSVWMAIGGVGALIAGLCGAPFWVQTAVFAGVTALALLISRPMVKKVMHFQKVDTNAGRYIGKTGIVTARIDNTEGIGQVTVLGSVWTARSADGSVLPEGENVVIKAIEGVKLIVEPENHYLKTE